MKALPILLCLTSFTLSLSAQDIQAKTERTTFSRTTSVEVSIQASPAIVWHILTEASDYPNWNSTVINIQGKIQEGEKIRLTSTLDPDRAFKLKIKDVTPEASMVWKGAMGKRHFTLTESDGAVIVTMTEKIGGLMFPLFANKIPPFDASFEAFARDLKHKAEASM